jgi:hypothetical protein
MMTKHLLTAALATLIVTAGGPGLSAQRGQGPQGPPPGNARLSGTYELDTARSADPQRTAQNATRSLPPGVRDRTYQNLLVRIDPPRVLSIEIRGRQVTIESTRGPRSAFDADGRSQREQGPDGRLVTTRAEISGNQMQVSTTSGNRASDYVVTFESLNNGADLRVTRHLDDNNLPRPITIQSYYMRSMPQARWDVYQPTYERWAGRSGHVSEGALVPQGSHLIASLDTPLSMRNSRHGEPFVMTVRGPWSFQGARITGVISRLNQGRDGRNNGDIGVDFQSIEYRGRTYEFDAVLDTMRLPDGTILRMNADGDLRERNRGEAAVQGVTIGAAVGAIIGALAGGGKGAVVGAAIGGTGGIILSQGHEQLDLPRGADVTLTALAPYRGR